MEDDCARHIPKEMSSLFLIMQVTCKLIATWFPAILVGNSAS